MKLVSSILFAVAVVVSFVLLWWLRDALLLGFAAIVIAILSYSQFIILRLEEGGFADIASSCCYSQRGKDCTINTSDVNFPKGQGTPLEPIHGIPTALWRHVVPQISCLELVPGHSD